MPQRQSICRGLKNTRSYVFLSVVTRASVLCSICGVLAPHAQGLRPQLDGVVFSWELAPLAHTLLRLTPRKPRPSRSFASPVMKLRLGLSLSHHRQSEDNPCGFQPCRWGRGFGLVEPLLGKDSMLNQPNSIFALPFFTLQLLLGMTQSATAALVLMVTAVVASAGCFYLAYLLLFVLHDMCFVCIASYLVTFALLTLDYRRLVHLHAHWQVQPPPPTKRQLQRDREKTE
uniref:vitamin K epoxide reductase complex subunit 1-like protein 1 isoform X1 n=1 Tax=Myxine glutinosa TaxID=7769 RepID=UPI00358E1A8E